MLFPGAKSIGFPINTSWDTRCSLFMIRGSQATSSLMKSFLFWA